MTRLTLGREPVPEPNATLLLADPVGYGALWTGMTVAVLGTMLIVTNEVVVDLYVVVMVELGAASPATDVAAAGGVEVASAAVTGHTVVYKEMISVVT